MRFPKLKHTVICQLLLCSPVIAALLLFFLLTRTDSGIVRRLPDVLCIFVVLLPLVLVLLYLLFFLPVLMLCTRLLFSIRDLRQARTEYITQRNGLGRAQIEARLLRRCRRWGKTATVSCTPQAAVFYRNTASFRRDYSAFERRVAVFSLRYLDADTYRRCLGAARHAFSQLPAGKPAFLSTPKERRAPHCNAPVVILLADGLAPDVRELPYRKSDLRCCVVDCPHGTYYFDCDRSEDYYEPGLEPLSPVYLQVALLKRLVFSGRLPKENQNALKPGAWQELAEMPFWEFVGTLLRELRDADQEEEKERLRMHRRLKDGQIEKGEYDIYLKSGELLISCAYLADPEDEKRLSLSMEDYGQKLDKAPLVSGLRKQRLSGKAKADAAARIQRWLAGQGYTWELSD